MNLQVDPLNVYSHQAAFATYADVLESFYREILFREPDPQGFQYYLGQLNDAHISPDQLQEAFIHSREYQQIIHPLLQEIKTLYAQFLFREPTDTEIRQHLNLFRHKFPTLEAAEQVVQEGHARIYLGIRPLKVVIDLTSRCNLRCVMCYFSDVEVFQRKRHDLSVEDFMKLAPQVFPLAHKVSLSGGAEPLMHPEFDVFLTVISAYEIPVLCMNTNGLLLNEKRMEHMIRSNFHAITISLDAATQDTYERIRVGSNFHRVISNIQTFQRIKQELGSAFPEISLSFVLMRSNIREFPAYVQLAHDLQIPRLHALHLVPYQELDNGHESLIHDAALCNQMLDEARDLAEHYHIELIAPENFIESPALPVLESQAPMRASNAIPERSMVPRPFKEWTRHWDLDSGYDETISCCPFPWHFIAITSQGEVAPCCWWHGEASMGNIKTQPFAQVWNNERYQILRAELMSGALRKTCQTCPAAGVGSVHDPQAFSLRAMPK